MAHLDGNGTDEAVTAMVSREHLNSVFEAQRLHPPQVSRVNELALGYPEGRIELQLIGGFRDQQGYAEDLFSNIMREFFYLSTLCLFLCGGKKVSDFKVAGGWKFTITSNSAS